MLFDTPIISEGTAIINTTVQQGTAYPSSPNRGEIFFRSDLNDFVFHNGTDWFRFATKQALDNHINDQVRHLTAAEKTLISGITVDAATINSIPSLKQDIDNGSAALDAHAKNYNLHLTVAQNTFLDGLSLPTLTAANVNQLIGVASNVQEQINTQTQTSSNIRNDLNTHVANATVHVLPSQRAWLDGINMTTITPTVMNKLDVIVAGGSAALRVAKTGDTMTGTLNMGANKVTSSYAPTQDVDLTNKKYVDTAIINSTPDLTGLVKKTGDTMTGTLNMGANAVISSRAPVGTSDLANKKYVDDAIYAVTSQPWPASTAQRLVTARDISLAGAAIGKTTTPFDGSANATINVTSLDATKLTNQIGIGPLSNLGLSVVSREMTVTDFNMLCKNADVGYYRVTTAMARANGPDDVNATYSGVLHVIRQSDNVAQHAVTQILYADDATAIRYATSSGVAPNETYAWSKWNYTTVKALGANVDLNMILTPGVYSQSTNVNAASGQNYPAGIAGILTVTAAAGPVNSSNIVQQMYHTYGSGQLSSSNYNAIYTRSYYAASTPQFSEWRKLVTEAGGGYVDLESAQTISGNKTFTSQIRANGGVAGNASSATKLATARTIGGVSFDGTANINLPGVNTAGTQNTSGNAAKADALTNARTITLTGAVQANATWDASGALELVTDKIDVSKANAGTLAVGRGGTGKTTHTAGQVLVGNGTGAVSSMAIDATTSGTADSGSLITSGAVNAGLALKANLASPSFTGTPTAPTAAFGTNSDQLATTKFVNDTLASKSPDFVRAVGTLEDLRNLTPYDNGSVVRVTEAIEGGIFRFNSADIAQDVAIDRGNNNVIAPAGQTGSLGAWVRLKNTAEFGVGYVPLNYTGGDLILEIEGLTNTKSFTPVNGYDPMGGDTVLYAGDYVVGSVNAGMSLMESFCKFYGYPIAVNDTWNVEDAARFFAKFDGVVWGDGYQLATHPENANTKLIAARVKELNPTIKIFGYIPIGLDPEWDDSNLPMQEIKDRIDAWKATGATHIFLDEFGYDYYITRERQNEAVAYCHAQGMFVCANSWSTEYCFSNKNVTLDWTTPPFEGNPNLLPSLLTSEDYIQFENVVYFYQHPPGTPSTANPDQYVKDNSRLVDMWDYMYAPQAEFGGKSYYEQYGTRGYALDAVLKRDEKMYRESYLIALALGMHAHAASVAFWGAADSNYNWYDPPKINANSRNALQKASISTLSEIWGGLITTQIGKDFVEIYWTQKAEEALFNEDSLPNDGIPKTHIVEVLIDPAATINSTGWFTLTLGDSSNPDLNVSITITAGMTRAELVTALQTFTYSAGFTSIYRVIAVPDGVRFESILPHTETGTEWWVWHTEGAVTPPVDDFTLVQEGNATSQTQMREVVLNGVAVDVGRGEYWRKPIHVPDGYAYYDTTNNRNIYFRNGDWYDMYGNPADTILPPVVREGDVVEAANKLATPRALTIGRTAKNFDGSAAVSWTATEILPTGTSGQVLKHNGTNWVASTDNNTTYSNMSQAEADAGTSTTGRVIQPTVLKAAILKHAPAPSDVTTSASGLMTAADKVKLNGIEVGATKDWTATAVASSADLNTYQTPGSYVCSANATAATLLNCPTTKAFTMRVWATAGCIQELQEYHSGGGAGLRRWTRGYYGSGAWSEWDEVVTKRYLPTPEEVLPSASTNQILKFNGTAWVAAAETNTTYAAMSATEANAGTATTARSITAAVLKGAIQTHAPTPTSVTGNAGTATKLATARQINGTNFDGSANIITANWGTVRTLTIGETGKSVNGSANVSWSLAEIGAAASNHTHSYLPLGGGTMTGAITLPSSGGSWISGVTAAPIRLPNASAANWHPWMSQRTNGGNGWVTGVLGNDFYISYATKANIDAGTNNTTQVVTVTSAGLKVTGTITATNNITAFSDRRLKKDLVEIDGALAKVKQLTGYTYTRIDTGERQTGLVAQDVQKVLPEAVQENSEHLSVAYGNLVGLLVNSIKELEQRVAELENKEGGN